MIQSESVILVSYGVQSTLWVCQGCGRWVPRVTMTVNGWVCERCQPSQGYDSLMEEMLEQG